MFFELGTFFALIMATTKLKSGGNTMSPRQAIRILMLSPIYFRLSPAQRWRLVREYCQLVKSCKL